MFVGVDCESEVFLDGIQRMVTFSFGREDGTAETLTIARGNALTAVQVLDWLFNTVVGPYTDGAGKLWRQVPIGFVFNHDSALILKEFAGPMQLVHKATARKRGLICWTTHKPGEPACVKFHRDDQRAASVVMSTGGEDDLLAWDPTSRYAFSSTPRRRLYVEHRPAGDRFDGNRRLDVHDVGSAFGGSLEKNIDAWRPELSDAARAHIARGKQDRKTGFQGWSPTEIAAYSELECVALARMARKLIEKVRAAGKIPIKPHQLFGSGSLATAAFKAYGVPKADELPDDVDTQGFDNLSLRELAMLDYFGGKIEAPVLGVLDDPVEEVDIAAAYPSQMIHLPCPREGHGEWQRVRGRDRIAALPRDAVGHVRVLWSIDEVTQIPPFMVRRKGGYVGSPLNGETIAALPEYFAAIDQFGPARIQGIVALVWISTCACEKPYAWMQELYDARRAMKAELAELDQDSPEYAELDAQQLAIKLVLNSCYGKIAQTRPYGTFTNLTFAATITSATRAQLNRQAWSQESRGGTVVYMHTDSVKSINGSPVHEGHKLGDWELTPKQICDFLIAQPGLAISLLTGKGATRGVHIDRFVEATRDWVATNDFSRPPPQWDPIKVPRTMMLSRKAAIARNSPELAGNFIDAPITIGFVSAKRAVFDARQLPGNSRAWQIPPQQYVWDQATLSDLIIWKSDLDKILAEQADEVESNHDELAR